MGKEIMDPLSWAEKHQSPRQIPWYKKVPEVELPHFFVRELGARVIAEWCVAELSKKYPDAEWPLEATRQKVEVLRRERRRDYEALVGTQ